ncbi:MAG TPA: metal ABC transporter permease [Methylomirabilota bacterium]|nr:metal ABC transporter permease [Methylomirabilota bacterium]
MVFEILQYSFMQRALLSGVVVAVTCSVVGLFLVLRRQSLFGDALSHAAFGGIAVGLFTSIYPLWSALVISVLAALGITKLRQSTKIPPDAAVAVMLSSGLALGIVLIGLAGGFNLDLESFLFGSILLVSMQDQLMILVLSAVVLVIIFKLYMQFIYITFSEDQARVSGINVTRLNYLFIALASLAVISSLRLVGVLLISSLIVIPNITAMMFGKGFKKTALISILVAVSSVLLGIVVSYITNLAPGGVIVLLTIFILLGTIGAKSILKEIKIRDLASKPKSLSKTT